MPAASAASVDSRLPRVRAAALVEALRADAAASDHEGGFPAASIAALAEAGLLGAPLPAALGGEDLGRAERAGELLATLAAVGHGNLAVGRLYEGHVNALQLVARYGSAAQRRRLADDALAGRLFGVWNTEAGDGVKLHADGAGGWRLSGAKTFASGCGHVARALVTAADEARGWQMMVLDTEREPPAIDASFWRPLGMRATASFRAGFDGRRVGTDDLLGRPGDYYREPAFGGGAIRFAAVQLGGVQAVFDETRRFLAGLGRTDDPHQRARLGEMAMWVESGRLWLDGAAAHAAAAMADPASGDAVAAAPEDRAAAGPDEAALAKPGDPAATVAYAHLMRNAVEAVALRVMPLAERAVGARGLLRPEPFERLHRDLTHYLRQPAPDAVVAAAGAHVLARPEPAATLWPAGPTTP